ncbi:hypothetical protein HK104_005701 [Borealophlyctis nickersoniae]|nr:hypothetical protein HK104_005701 [Borealophlyctis nickersoniae]
MSMRYHPDKNPDDDSAKAKFLEVSEAYSTLSDVAKRQEYDRDLNFESPGGAPHTRHFTSREPRTGPGRPRPLHKRNLNPDDWVQYRRGPGMAGRPIFNFDAHQEAHYEQAIRESKRRRERRESMDDLLERHYHNTRHNVFHIMMSIFWGTVLGTLILTETGFSMPANASASEAESGAERPEWLEQRLILAKMCSEGFEGGSAENDPPSDTRLESSSSID